MSTSLARRIADLPLRRKLMLITMTIVLAATCTTLVFMHRQATRTRSADFVQNALAQARLVAEYAVSPLVFEDDKGARELLAKLALDPRVAYVRLDDARGQPFAEIASRTAGVEPPPAWAGEPYRLDARALHVSVPVVQKGTLGALRVGFRLDELERALGSEERFLLLVLGGVVLASYLLTLWLQRIISAPLLTLERHAREVAESQDFSRQLESPGRDEVGSLYLAFNHLIERIRKSQDDILALNRSLESKVAERTRDLELARDRADRASLSKSEFLANMSHEIRTPINAITGFTSLAMRTELDPRQADYVEKIHTAAQGLLHIVNDLLDFSKIEAGHMTLERIAFRLAEVMETVVAYVGTLAERKGLELLIDVSPDVPATLVGDPMRLGQVLINLCNNAVKFTARGEVEVRVSVAQRPGTSVMLRFEVRDTGIGLTPEQAAKLFQAFTQADPSTTRKFGGTGLGLVISKRIVGLMNGRIWLESAPNVGTTFFFEAQLEVGETVESAESSLPEALRGQRALVVDDNVHARQILVTQLTALGLDVLAVDSAELGLTELRRASRDARPYPLVLMDWKMPGMDGLAATRAIRADPTIAGTPVVIMVTAFGREHDLGDPENTALLDGVLFKPVTPAVLAQTLHRLLATGGDRTARRQALSAPRSQALPGVRVLLVEDNPINQQVARELLAHEGAEVRLAGNGREALEALAATGIEFFDVALVDLQMPEMDGYEATRRIRELPHGARLPLIALTAHAMQEERERCLAAGMNDHVAKPIDPDVLVSKVALWVGSEGIARAALRTREQPAFGAAAAAAAATSVPRNLPGIDVETALSRCVGDAALLRDLLVQFHRHYASAAVELDRLLAAGAFAEARRLAHSIKGAAANLGANAVADAAAGMENAIHADRADAAQPLGALAAALAVVNAGLAPLSDAQAPAPDREVARPPADGARVRDVVKALLTCLEQNDTRAEQWIADLRALQGGSEPRWLAAASAAIQALDYEKALEYLRAGGLKP